MALNVSHCGEENFAFGAGAHFLCGGGQFPHSPQARLLAGMLLSYRCGDGSSDLF